MNEIKHALGLEGQKALVVGGGFGIGRQTARLLADAGARVAVADLNESRARAVAEEIGGHAIVGDVMAPDGARQIVDEAHAALGGLNRLANIIGGVVMKRFMDTDADLWRQQLEFNLIQQMNVCHAAGRHMLAEGGGSIALVSSVSGLWGARSMVAYGASKAALNSLARTLADEWGPHGIRVNTIAPDNTATSRIIDRSGTTSEETFARLDASAAEEGVPLRRGGREHEQAGALFFLLSDLSSFITGQCLVVDGGSVIHFPRKALDAIP